jgi:Tol biopolymer transport system component/LmbE family N-acetylglucosaminyl deacetylase/lysophospholipase L1-like esterase
MRIGLGLLCLALGGAAVPSSAASQTGGHKLVAVFAHPDDERIVGPLLARYAREGQEVYLVIATDGSKGVTDFAHVPAGDSLAHVRAGEARCAARELGIHPPRLLGLVDARLASFGSLERLRDSVRRVLRELQPDAVITFGPEGGTGHPDHRLVGDVVTEVVQSGGDGIPQALYYPSLPSERMASAPRAEPTVTSVPQRYLPIAVPFTPQDLEATHRAFACHATQYTPAQVDSVIRYLAHGFDGAVHLRAWYGGGAARTDLFDAPAPAPARSDSIIKSSLQTVDIASGHIETVYSEDRHFEAPNWSRDGQFFVLNSEGRLYRLPVSGNQSLEEIPTGFATKVNNDHGISPDGKWLALSHSAAELVTDPAQDWFASSVYVLPVEGSATPVKVTTGAPSFWHGWSPDGKTLAFVGRRNGEFDVYTIPVSGGAERRLTTCRGLDDGPDYSADGTFIYYNSFCSGKMEIWRMRPDGSQAEQLTHDAYANWFPHPSPDGRWVAFLAYLTDQGENHPFGKQVKLRLMDLRDGSVRDLTPPFFGGQGTINVPSWSPDSRRVAFVSYEVTARPQPNPQEERLHHDWAYLARYREENARLGPPKPSEQRVVFYGNSITEAWPQYFGTMFPGKPYVGRGISGQTTPQMLVRFRQDVIGLSPAVVVILAGTNDIAGNTGPSTLGMIEDNLASMVELAQANGIRVVLSSVLPAFDYPWRPGLEPAQKIIALNTWMKRYAADHHAVYLDYHSATVDERGGLKAELSADGVHPNEAGYRIMAPLAEQAITQALLQPPGGGR